MARRGRPRGTDSAQTRQRIIDVAREQFARRGYAVTGIATIAAAADLAPSAVYHYFDGKVELYETVFETTADQIWQSFRFDQIAHDTLLEALEDLLDASTRFGPEQTVYNDFLAMVPMEARLHPEFAHLIDRRSKYQDETFGALADLGLQTGELAGIERQVAVEMIRSAIMGSFLERHFRPALQADSLVGTKELFRRLLR